MQQTAREERRADVERELAERRAQDEALQAYLDQMSDLLLAKDGLRESKEGSEVRTLARARTITVLERLDPERRSAVLQFLVEANLVQGVGERAPEESFDPTIEPGGANLSGAGTEPAAPIITLSGANLHGAILSEANLSGAELRDADLSGATLFAVVLSGANLYRANLNDARMPYTSLSGANLYGANLSGAELVFADLDGANLANANLNGAVGVSNEELEQQAESLEGATMPNGQKYEDWIKSRAEDGKNGSPS
jgi:uncharacterized protein YjbI with pentapeptide repeats